MTQQEATGTAADGRFSLCLSDIDGFESVIARMPTPTECLSGFPGNVPVLILRRHGGVEQLYFADRIRLTIDTSAAPDAAEAPLQEIVRLADEYRRERAGEVS